MMDRTTGAFKTNTFNGGSSMARSNSQPAGKTIPHFKSEDFGVRSGGFERFTQVMDMQNTASLQAQAGN